MTKKSSILTQRRSIIFLLAIVAVAVIIIGVLYPFALQRLPSYTPQADTLAEGSVQIKGEMVCLPHKDTSGPQTMECAFGLKDEKGRYYGLQDTDPGYQNIAGVPMNTKVRVSGTFKKKSDDKYPIIGIIEVTKITREETE